MASRARRRDLCFSPIIDLCVLVVSLGVEAWKLSALRRYMTVGGAAEGDGGGGGGADALVLLRHPRPAPSLLSDTAAASSGNVVRIFAQDGDQDES